MAIAAIGELIEALRQSRLLEPARLEELTRLQAKFTDPKELARHLIRKGWLTPYQANQVFHGHGKDLVLGQYHLLDRLGEGGMGQVFKARHQKLDRVVALKIIRKERLDNPNAVRRFHREIRAAAQLLHPNIVMAFDADQVGQTHFFAMEYVEGIDLDKYVKEVGPLPIEQACDYIRQAALGLQHASECGLVHRDIKPANLLVERRVPSAECRVEDKVRASSAIGNRQSAFGNLKILDMGLARLRDKADDDSEAASRITQEGTVMGTPDYIAPEQAMNSSTADVRADLYSLGCSFYFLLTGKVPFPGGTMMEKIMRHRSDPPVPPESMRPDIPPRVRAILRKLLAKKPEERYQAPAEVARDLAGYLDGAGGLTSPAVMSSLVAASKSVASAVRSSVEATRELALGTRELVERRPGAAKKRNWKRLLLLAAALLLAVIILVPKKKLTDDGSKNDGSIVAGPSLLDRIDPAKLQRQEGQPRELVAVLGQPGRSEKIVCLGFSSDGKLLAGGGEDNLVHLWDLETLREQRLLPKQAGAVGSVAIRADGKFLACGGLDPGGMFRLWALGQPEPRLAAEQIGNANGVDALAFSPDGAILATAGGDNTVRLWDCPDGKPKSLGVLMGHRGPIYAVAFAPNGKILASGGKDHSVRLWDVLRNRDLANWKEHTDNVHALAYAPDGKTLASGGRDKNILLRKLDGDVQQEIITLKQLHTGTITGLAFAPNGQRLLSAGDDGQVIVWQLVAREVYCKWAFPWPIRGVVYAPDGRHLATANGDGTIYILRVP